MAKKNLGITREFLWIFTMNKFSHFDLKSVKFTKINSLKVFFYSAPCKVKTASSETTTTETATVKNKQTKTK